MDIININLIETYTGFIFPSLHTKFSLLVQVSAVSLSSYPPPVPSTHPPFPSSASQPHLPSLPTLPASSAAAAGPASFNHFSSQPLLSQAPPAGGGGPPSFSSHPSLPAHLPSSSHANHPGLPSLPSLPSRPRTPPSERQRRREQTMIEEVSYMEESCF